MALGKSSPTLIVFCIIFAAKTSDANLWDECWSNWMCNSWQLECVNFQCACISPYVPSMDNAKCVIGIDGVCERYQDECYDPNAHCNQTNSWIGTGSWCACKEGFTQDPETRLCAKNIGEECEADGTSCIEGSCVDGTCQCPAGLSPSQFGDSCGVAVGGTCTDDHPTCADPYAECQGSGSLCECKEGHQAVVREEDGMTVCRTALGGACQNASECAAFDTSCELLRQGISACTCIVSYVPSEDRSACLPVVNHWASACQEDLQCTAMFGRYSTCSNNICDCQIGYIYSAADFGCVAIHGVAPRSHSESVKLLATTLLPYLPTEAKIAVHEILDEL
ncbi:multiple epidermal growth factor-like domains protein 10 [Neodiprion pinetum]|uniref:multiple epidermal growth factor-like domains protein 10 n=1 Tax=Neodiprion pinetum TaxID=441929 RepID=UPI001EDE9F94|nr:multiple epidermal growth factor-like domains protein 6 [Neodiprion pinetum]